MWKESDQLDSARLCLIATCHSTSRYFQLSKAVGEDITREDLVVAFVRLLKDNEAEVRTAAAGQAPGTAVISSALLARNVPCALQFT